MEALSGQTQQTAPRPFNWDNEFRLVWTNLPHGQGATVASLIEKAECLFFGEIHSNISVESTNVRAVNALAGRCCLVTEEPRLAKHYGRYGLDERLVKTTHCWLSSTPKEDRAHDGVLLAQLDEGKKILSLATEGSSLTPKQVVTRYVTINQNLMKALYVDPLPSVRVTREIGEDMLALGGVRELVHDLAGYWLLTRQHASQFFGMLTATSLELCAVNILNATVSAREMGNKKVCLFAGADHLFDSGLCRASEAHFVQQAAILLRRELTTLQFPTVILFTKNPYPNPEKPQARAAKGKQKGPAPVQDEGERQESDIGLLEAVDALQTRIEALLQEAKAAAPPPTMPPLVDDQQSSSPENSPKSKGKGPDDT